jgi:L-asparaginase / beta-aspartyl-peptidase
MKNLFYFSLCLFLSLSCTSNPTIKKPDYALVLHGGAGTMAKKDFTPEKEAAYNAALNEALNIGEAVLKNGGTSMDAVEKVICYLEDNPLFNAGKGAVFTHAGKNELDASFMDGATQKAGAVAGVTTIKNPIKAARAVMEKSPHVMLSGKGAEQFAIEQHLDTVPQSYFFTQDRWDSLQKMLEEEKNKQAPSNRLLDNTQPNNNNTTTSLVNNDKPLSEQPRNKFGTVGCVALDKQGNIAAGTSTGGMTNKRWGRVGDAPIIGAGTYADNAVAGVSCTGWGEYFIRYTVARSICALVEYKNMPIQEAGNEIVVKKLTEKGGDGGAIGLDKNGNVMMSFNSEGMYRGFLKSTGERKIGIYK